MFLLNFHHNNFSQCNFQTSKHKADMESRFCWKALAKISRLILLCWAVLQGFKAICLFVNKKIEARQVY